MRFHIVALPHTQVTKEFAGCAFTEKVRRFCIMMHDLGHEVFLYAGEEVEAPVTELITCIGEDQRAAAVATVPHYTQYPFSGGLWWNFNTKAIEGIRERIEKEDFIALNLCRVEKPNNGRWPVL